MNAEWVNMFVNGFHPKDPKFYHYKIRKGKNGEKSKVYYMIGKDSYTVISKSHIPPEIINSIPEYDSHQDHFIEKKELEELNKKCEKYTHKIEGCTKLKEILENDIERLIYTYGKGIDISWYYFDPQCYYWIPTPNGNLDKKVYSYLGHRTVEDINRRRELVLQSDKKATRPVREVVKELPIAREKVGPFVEKWLIWSKMDQIDKLGAEIKKTISLFDRTKKHIETLTFGIDLFLKEGIDTNQKFYEGRRKEKELWDEFSKTRRETFDSFFERMYSWYDPPTSGWKFEEEKSSSSSSRNSSESRSSGSGFHQTTYATPRQVLAKYNIHNKKEWKEWLRNNHPDKGGTQEDCRIVISVGREIGY